MQVAIRYDWCSLQAIYQASVLRRTYLKDGPGLIYKAHFLTKYIFENLSTSHALRCVVLAVCCTKEKPVTTHAL